MRGEDEAARFLTRSGYAIVDRNVRTRAGEIDLVAKEGKTLVFVEVKTRRDLEGDPPQAVTGPRRVERRLGPAGVLGGFGECPTHGSEEVDRPHAVPLRRGLRHHQRRGRRQGHPTHPQRVLRRALVTSG
ncbi:MAG: hypothetical protein DMD86_07120 [Candidatus Rokuibacteriota bacterium]|nr:MAG: hypothetical protein DMD86_07120 [Candidatus Rokubacteria bacterium]